MNKTLKQLLLQQKFNTTNIVDFIELLYENGCYDVYRIIELLINGCPKYRLNHTKIQETINDYYTQRFPETKIIEFTDIIVNPLEDRIRVYFDETYVDTNSTHNNYYDLYNIKDYCNE